MEATGPCSCSFVGVRKDERNVGLVNTTKALNPYTPSMGMPKREHTRRSRFYFALPYMWRVLYLLTLVYSPGSSSCLISQPSRPPSGGEASGHMFVFNPVVKAITRFAGFPSLISER